MMHSPTARGRPISPQTAHQFAFTTTAEPTTVWTALTDGELTRRYLHGLAAHSTTKRALRHLTALQPAEAARVLASLPLHRAAVRAVLDAARTSSAVLPSLPADLTERELEILRLLAAGRTKPQIASGRLTPHCE